MKLRRRRVEGENAASILIEGDKERDGLALVDSLGVIEHVRYVELAVHARRWADLLRLHGVRPGDRVVVLAGFDRVWGASLFGVMETGAVAVPCRAHALDEIRAIADEAGAAILISATARPELMHGEGLLVLSGDRLPPPRTPDEETYVPMPDDPALLLYAADAEGLRGALHTHASVLAHADAGARWLGLTAGERIWTTVPEGSAESIWALLAAWRAGAEIVTFDPELSPGEQLELVARLRPAAIWLSDREYGALVSTEVPYWLDLGSVRRALTTGAPGDGALAFHGLVGPPLAPVYSSKETGVFAACPPQVGHDLALTGIGLAIVDAAGNEVAPGREGELAIAADAPTLFLGYAGEAPRERPAGDWFRLDRDGAIDPDGVLRFASGAPAPRLESSFAPDFAVPETAPDPPAAAEPVRDRRREKREAKERERLKRDEERRLEQEAKARAKAEEQRLRDEAKAREEAERSLRAAALADDRRRAEEARERERTEAQERRRAEEAEREEALRRKGAERAAAEAEQRRVEERSREEERLRAAVAEEAERERLAPDILSSIGHYGIGPLDPDRRREREAETLPAAAEVEKPATE
jgi:hypothetical protein